MGRIVKVMVAVMVAATSSPVFAQPRPPVPPKPAAPPVPPKPASPQVPTTTVPCLPYDARLTAVGGAPVVCWSGGCMKLDVDAKTATSVAAPPPVPAWTMPLPEVKTDTVCLGATCKKLGAKLVAAVANERSTATPTDPARFEATTDLKAVVVGQTAWNVAADKPLAFRYPGRKPHSAGGVSVAGSFMLVPWSDCAGPCTEVVLVDSSGRNLSGAAPGGTQPFQLDAKRFIAVGEYAVIDVYDLKTGKGQRGIVLERAEPDGDQTVRLDDAEIAVLYREMPAHDSASRLVTINFVSGDPWIDHVMTLPHCPRTFAP